MELGSGGLNWVEVGARFSNTRNLKVSKTLAAFLDPLINQTFIITISLFIFFTCMKMSPDSSAKYYRDKKVRK